MGNYYLSISMDILASCESRHWVWLNMSLYIHFAILLLLHHHHTYAWNAIRIILCSRKTTLYICAPVRPYELFIFNNTSHPIVNIIYQFLILDFIFACRTKSFSNIYSFTVFLLGAKYIYVTLIERQRILQQKAGIPFSCKPEGTTTAHEV